MRHWFLSLFVIAASAAYVTAEAANPSADSAFALDQGGTSPDSSLSVSPAKTQPTTTPAQPAALPPATPAATRTRATDPAPRLTVTKADPAPARQTQAAQTQTVTIAQLTQTPTPAPAAQTSDPAQQTVHIASASTSGTQVISPADPQQPMPPKPMPKPDAIPAPAPNPDPGPAQQVADVPVPMPRPDRSSPAFTTASLKAAQAAPPQRNGAFRDGSYTGSVANAYYGMVQVQAVVQNGRLVSVRILRYPNDRRTSRYISGHALPILKRESIAAQSASVHIISGATLVSRAYRRSLGTALSKAKA